MGMFGVGHEALQAALRHAEHGPTARAVIDRIRDGLAKTTLAQDGSTAIVATASFGLALLEPDVGVEESINRAARALYDAKAAGRNRTHAWDSLVP